MNSAISVRYYVYFLIYVCVCSNIAALSLSSISIHAHTHMVLVSSDHMIRCRSFASNFFSLKEAETNDELCGIPRTKMLPATLILKKAVTQTQIPPAQIAAFSSSVFVNETSSSSKVNPIEPTSVFRLYLAHKYISPSKF